MAGSGRNERLLSTQSGHAQFQIGHPRANDSW